MADCELLFASARVKCDYRLLSFLEVRRLRWKKILLIIANLNAHALVMVNACILICKPALGFKPIISGVLTLEWNQTK